MFSRIERRAEVEAIATTISQLVEQVVLDSWDWSGVAYVHDGSIAASAVLLDSGLHLLTAAHVAEALALAASYVTLGRGRGGSSTRLLPSNPIRHIVTLKGSQYTTTWLLLPLSRRLQ